MNGAPEMKLVHMCANRGKAVKHLNTSCVVETRGKRMVHKGAHLVVLGTQHHRNGHSCQEGIYQNDWYLIVVEDGSTMPTAAIADVSHNRCSLCGINMALFIDRDDGDWKHKTALR